MTDERITEAITTWARRLHDAECGFTRYHEVPDPFAPACAETDPEGWPNKAMWRHIEEFEPLARVVVGHLMAEDA